jgi:hypothetical protein
MKTTGSGQVQPVAVNCEPSPVECTGTESQPKTIKPIENQIKPKKSPHKRRIKRF